MNKIFSLLLISIISAFCISKANAYNGFNIAEQFATKICTKISKDDRRGFRHDIHRERTRVRLVFSGITCDENLNMLQFAFKTNSKNVGFFYCTKT